MGFYCTKPSSVQSRLVFEPTGTSSETNHMSSEPADTVLNQPNYNWLKLVYIPPE